MCVCVRFDTHEQIFASCVVNFSVMSTSFKFYKDLIFRCRADTQKSRHFSEIQHFALILRKEGWNIYPYCNIHTQNTLILTLITINLDNVSKKIVRTFLKSKSGSRTKINFLHVWPASIQLEHLSGLCCIWIANLLR